MSNAKLLNIDSDLWDATLTYVAAQVETMRKFEALPKDWNSTREYDLAMRVAQYPQKIRNMNKNPVFTKIKGHALKKKNQTPDRIPRCECGLTPPLRVQGTPVFLRDWHRKHKEELFG